MNMEDLEMDAGLNFEELANEPKPNYGELNLNEGKSSILSTLGVNFINENNSEVNTKVVDDNEIDEVENNIIEEVIDTNVDEPNIILTKTELVRALRYASIMIKKVTNDIEASSLNITLKDDGKVEYKLKDNMTWVTLTGDCEVSNNNPITETLSFNIVYLTKLLSVASSKVLLYKGKAIDAKNEEVDVLYIRLSNGDYIVDCFNGNEQKLIPAGNKTTKMCSLQPSVVATLCDVMTPMIADTQEVQYKRTTLYEDKAIFRSSTYLISFKNTFSRMCLGKKELDLLKLVAIGAGNNEIEVYNTDSNGENRILFIAPNIVISTAVSIPNVDETINVRLAELNNNKYVKINKDELKRVLMLSGIGLGNVGRVELNYNVENKGLDAKTVGKNGNSSLLISGENYNNVEPRNESITIYSPNLMKLLKAFDSGKDLEIALLQNGLALKDSSIGIEAMMNYSL